GVEDRPAADARLVVALAATPREVAERRADPTGEHEAQRRRACGDERELRLQLAADVRCLAELAAQLLDSSGQLLALGVELAADLLRRARRRHQRFNASVVSLASRIACSGTGGVPFLILPSASIPSRPATASSPTVTIRSASHVERNVASAAAIVAKAKPRPKIPRTAAPTAIPIPIPSATTFFFSSRAASSISRRAIADACSATDFAAPPTPPFACTAVVCDSDMRVGVASPVENLREQVAARERDPDHEPRADPAGALRLLGPFELR